MGFCVAFSDLVYIIFFYFAPDGQASHGYDDEERHQTLRHGAADIKTGAGAEE